MSPDAFGDPMPDRNQVGRLDIPVASQLEGAPGTLPFAGIETSPDFSRQFVAGGWKQGQLGLRQTAADRQDGIRDILNFIREVEQHIAVNADERAPALGCIHNRGA